MSTVADMLAQPEYMGHTINFRTHSSDYKERKLIRNPKEEWKVFENTHEAIIDKETWELVQKLRGTPRKYEYADTPNPLTGLLFCADCGAKLYNNSEKARSIKEDKNHFILDSKEPTDSFGEFLETEVRYTSLKRAFPDIASELFNKAEEASKERYQAYLKKSKE